MGPSFAHSRICGPRPTAWSVVDGCSVAVGSGKGCWNEQSPPRMCFPLPGALPILLMDVWVISTVFGFCRRSRCERPSAGFEMNVCFRFSWGRCLGMGWVARLEHDGLWKKLPNGAHPRMSAEQRPLAAWDATPLQRRPLVSARCVSRWTTSHGSLCGFHTPPSLWSWINYWRYYLLSTVPSSLHQLRGDRGLCWSSPGPRAWHPVGTVHALAE